MRTNGSRVVLFFAVAILVTLSLVFGVCGCSSRKRIVRNPLPQNTSPISLEVPSGGDAMLSMEPGPDLPSWNLLGKDAYPIGENPSDYYDKIAGTSLKTGGLDTLFLFPKPGTPDYRQVLDAVLAAVAKHRNDFDWMEGFTLSNRPRVPNPNAKLIRRRNDAIEDLRIQGFVVANDGSVSLPASKSSAQHKPSKPRVQKIDEHGPMNFNPPSSMTKGDTITVDVAIRRPVNPNYDAIPTVEDAKSKFGLHGSGPMQAVDVPVADYMKVELRAEDSEAFTIDPKDPVTKSLPKDGHAEWHWKVTALKAGDEVLILHSVRIPHKPNGDQLPEIDDGSRTAQIHVAVLPTRVVIKKGAMDLLKEDWKEIVGALGTGAVALIAAWWAWWKKKHNLADSKD